MLVYLNENRDRVVSKQELLDHVWGRLAVEEGNLTVQISALRKLLGSRSISTVPGVGYKLTVDAGPPAARNGPALPDVPSLAVLPFANLTGRPDNDYLVDGIVADLVSALSRIGEVFVIAASSSFKYKGQPISLSDVGVELGVRYLLEGSIQMGGSRLRITTQLVEAQSGRTIWSDRFEGGVEDVFDLQDRIAEQTASALELKLTLAEAARSRSKPTASLQAYDLCLQAAPMVYRVSTRSQFDEAMKVLDRALDLDPDYSTAKALKIRAYMMGVAARALTYEEGLPGIDLARGLLVGHQGDPFALVHAGHMLAYLGREAELGYRALMQAVSMNPNSVIVLVSAGWVAAYTGRYEEALGYFERNFRLNPLHPNTAHGKSGHGYALLGLGRYEEAVEALEVALAEDPGFGTTSFALIVAYDQAGRRDAARRLCARYREEYPWYSLRTYREGTPFTDPALRSVCEQSLRSVGMPEDTGQIA